MITFKLNGKTVQGEEGQYILQVAQKYGVNMLACICAIDRAALPPLMDYWVPGVRVTGVHEMVANALICKGEKKRTVNLRGEPLPGMEGE